MKTTKQNWIVNASKASIEDSSIYTMEALREDFGDSAWKVSVVTADGRERFIDDMDWNSFVENWAQNNGSVGWLHLTAEAPEDSVMSVFGMSQEMWVCPISVTDIDSDEWRVYLSSPVESNEVACYKTLLEAVCYVLDETYNETKLAPRDTDNGNNHHWFEIYKGDFVTETDDEPVYNAPIYTSKKYYNC